MIKIEMDEFAIFPIALDNNFPANTSDVLLADVISPTEGGRL